MSEYKARYKVTTFLQNLIPFHLIHYPRTPGLCAIFCNMITSCSGFVISEDTLSCDIYKILGSVITPSIATDFPVIHLYAREDYIPHKGKLFIAESVQK